MGSAETAQLHQPAASHLSRLWRAENLLTFYRWKRQPPSGRYPTVLCDHPHWEKMVESARWYHNPRNLAGSNSSHRLNLYRYFWSQDRLFRTHPDELCCPPGSIPYFKQSFP